MLTYVNSHSTKNDIVLNNITLSIGTRKLLDDTNLTIIKGNKYFLVGNNGTGKTTLIKAIMELNIIGIPMSYVDQHTLYSDCTVIESLINSNTEFNKMYNELELIKNKISTETDIFTEEYDKILERRDELEAIVYENSKYIGTQYAESILAGLGFSPEQMQNPTNTFSGGWLKRIQLAQVLYKKARMVLLDEPTNHLDINTILWLTDYIKSDERTYIIVTHDNWIIENVCTKIIKMHNQRLEYYNNYTHYKTTCDSENHSYRFGTAMNSDNALINISDVTFQYTPLKQILKKIDNCIWGNTKIGIIGPNGAGKSTLIKLIIGDLEPTSGTLTTSRHTKPYYLDQHYIDNLPLDKTAAEYLYSRFNANIKIDIIRKYLGGFGLSGILQKQQICSLSGGQKTRVALTEIALVNPQILILDEPTNHLDSDSIKALESGLGAYEGALIAISHNIGFLKSVCEKYWYLDGSGSIEEIDDITDVCGL